MNFSNISDLNSYKIVFIFSILFFIILCSTNILENIFGNISYKKYKLFIFSFAFAFIVFGIILPIFKIKLFTLSTKKNLNKIHLYDFFHNIKLNENIENFFNKINDYIPSLFLILYIYLCINKKKINGISYILIGLSVIFIIKYILAFATILPDSSGKCKLNLTKGACNDLLCSGHFSIVLLTYLLIVKYKLLNKNVSNILLFIVILYSIIPVLSKHHYTIDILVALIIVILVNNYIPKK